MNLQAISLCGSGAPCFVYIVPVIDPGCQNGCTFHTLKRCFTHAVFWMLDVLVNFTFHITRKSPLTWHDLGFSNVYPCSVFRKQPRTVPHFTQDIVIPSMLAEDLMPAVPIEYSDGAVRTVQTENKTVSFTYPQIIYEQLRQHAPGGATAVSLSS